LGRSRSLWGVLFGGVEVGGVGGGGGGRWGVDAGSGAGDEAPTVRAGRGRQAGGGSGGSCEWGGLWGGWWVGVCGRCGDVGGCGCGGCQLRKVRGPVAVRLGLEAGGILESRWQFEGRGVTGGGAGGGLGRVVLGREVAGERRGWGGLGGCGDCTAVRAGRRWRVHACRVWG